MGGGGLDESGEKSPARPAGYSTAAKQRTVDRAERLLQAIGKATKLSKEDCGKVCNLEGQGAGLALKWALKHKGWFEEKAAGFWVLSKAGKDAFFGLADRVTGEGENDE